MERAQASDERHSTASPRPKPHRDVALPAGARLARDILTATLDVNHEHGTDLSTHPSLVTA